MAKLMYLPTLTLSFFISAYIYKLRISKIDLKHASLKFRLPDENYYIIALDSATNR